MINKEIADLARKYTTLSGDSADKLDITHCLDRGDYFFCPDVDWMEAIEEEDIDRLSEAYHEVHNRFAQRLPDGYGELKQIMLPALRDEAERIARQINQLYALPPQGENGIDRKSRLHEVRRLSEHLGSLVSEYGEEPEIRDHFPESIEFRYIESPQQNDSGKEGLEAFRNLKKCVIYEKAGFFPTLSYELASCTLGRALERVDTVMERHEEKASELYRSFAWVREQLKSLHRSLYEYEVFGHVSTIDLEEAREKTREEAKKRGRPRELDREAVKRVLIDLLVNRRNCWHSSGPKIGEPNASAIHGCLMREHQSLIMKENGTPATKAWVRNRIKELGDDTIAGLRSRFESTQTN